MATLNFNFEINKTNYQVATKKNQILSFSKCLHLHQTKPLGDNTSEIFKLDHISLMYPNFAMFSLNKHDLTSIYFDQTQFKQLLQLQPNNVLSEPPLEELISSRCSNNISDNFQITGLTVVNETLQIFVTLRQINNDVIVDSVNVNVDGDAADDVNHIELMYILSPSYTPIGFYNINQYFYLTGNNLPGYHSGIVDIVTDIKPIKHITISSLTLSRTVISYTDKTLVVEWRPILQVNQYYYEIYQVYRLPPSIKLNQLLKQTELGEFSQIDVSNTIHLKFTKGGLSARDLPVTQYLTDLFTPRIINILNSRDDDVVVDDVNEDKIDKIEKMRKPFLHSKANNSALANASAIANAGADRNMSKILVKTRAQLRIVSDKKNNTIHKIIKKPTINLVTKRI